MGTVNKPYDEKKDAALYALVPEGWPLRLSAGPFTILFPEDAHAPCCIWGSPCEVRNVVMKVRI